MEESTIARMVGFERYVNFHLIIIIVDDAFDDNVTGIAYPEKALKKDLWNVIKECRTPPEYVIVKIAEEKGDF